MEGILDYETIRVVILAESRPGENKSLRITICRLTELGFFFAQ